MLRNIVMYIMYVIAKHIVLSCCHAIAHNHVTYRVASWLVILYNILQWNAIWNVAFYLILFVLHCPILSRNELYCKLFYCAVKKNMGVYPILLKCNVMKRIAMCLILCCCSSIAMCCSELYLSFVQCSAMRCNDNCNIVFYQIVLCRNITAIRSCDLMWRW